MDSYFIPRREMFLNKEAAINRYKNESVKLIRNKYLIQIKID